MNDRLEWFAKVLRDHPLFWLGLILGFVLGDQWMAHVGQKILAQSIAIMGLSIAIGMILGILRMEDKNANQKT